MLKRRGPAAAVLPIPTIDLTESSPENSPGPSSLLTRFGLEEQQQPEKKARLVEQFQPPVPDAIEIEKSCAATIKLDNNVSFQIHQPPPCTCVRVPGLLGCRCLAHHPPHPQVRITGNNCNFELLDMRWAAVLQDMAPTPLAHLLGTNPELTKLIFYPLEGEVGTGSEIEVSANLTIQGSHTVAGTDEIKTIEYDLGNHRFLRNSHYTFPLNRVILSNLLSQPMGSPGFQYPSTVRLTTTLRLVVTNFKNINREPRFTLDFSKRGDLADFVILFGEKPLFVDVKYLSHYSEYFRIVSSHVGMDNGLVKIDDGTGLPCLKEESEDDYEAFNAILLHCSPCRTQIPNGLLVDVLRLCDKYQLCTVKREAESKLIRLIGANKSRTPEYSDLEYLVIAERFNLHLLKEHAISNLFRNSSASPSFLTFFSIIQNDPNYHQLSVATKAHLVDRIHDFNPTHLQLPTGPLIPATLLGSSS